MEGSRTDKNSHERHAPNNHNQPATTRDSFLPLGHRFRNPAKRYNMPTFKQMLSKEIPVASLNYGNSSIMQTSLTSKQSMSIQMNELGHSDVQT